MRGGRLLITDNDGWLDLFFVNGTRFEAAWPKSQAPTSRLYKNNRDGTFTDVTLKAGVARTGWGQGVCAGTMTTMGTTTYSLLTGATAHSITTMAMGPSPM